MKYDVPFFMEEKNENVNSTIPTTAINKTFKFNVMMVNVMTRVISKAKMYTADSVC